ncbi:uncharacterized protein LOC105684897 isoform X2 [Athalia rosae]|uniref:uncharacterized protein LOC105684897 isoform X2 n=1 Tax=Athalia rosae TaxID=37344 RepID=UPI0020336698|nr:uncharacterized protein LOC105684897 isoform X2 [Athalia rosae]
MMGLSDESGEIHSYSPIPTRCRRMERYRTYFNYDMARIFNIINRGAGVRLSNHTGLIFFIIIIVSLPIELPSVHGRKCVCTSKSCLEAGTDTRRTRFSCYTELILIDEGQGNTTTRGCADRKL